MNFEKIYKIALVIKTDGLEYDDRVRKEILTIQKLFPNISFKIFVMLPENREYEGVTSYGIPYRVVYLKTRDKYPSAKKLLRKSYEFYKVIKDELKQYDAIWCGDQHCFMVTALAKNKRILWDLHEIPNRFMGNRFLEFFLKYIFYRCKVVLHANPQRCEYMARLGLISNIAKHFAIRNYPNFDDVDQEYDCIYRKFITWKNKRNCVYLQGLNNDGRAAYESVKTVLDTENLVAVVVGSFDTTTKERLVKEYGNILEKRVFFAGRIPQLKIPQYVKECITTMVFYKNTRPNNYYCEANRFYQSVILGLPVLVGCNPSMKELVEKYGLGVCIDNDGSSITMIKEGLGALLSKYDFYKENVMNNCHHLVWNQQEPVFRQIIETLFDDIR